MEIPNRLYMLNLAYDQVVLALDVEDLNYKIRNLKAGYEKENLEIIFECLITKDDRKEGLEVEGNVKLKGNNGSISTKDVT